jgi:hypothetical protein
MQSDIICLSTIGKVIFGVEAGIIQAPGQRILPYIYDDIRKYEHQIIPNYSIQSGGLVFGSHRVCSEHSDVLLCDGYRICTEQFDVPVFDCYCRLCAPIYCRPLCTERVEGLLYLFTFQQMLNVSHLTFYLVCLSTIGKVIFGVEAGIIQAISHISA